ncbi:tRNA dimethylallyltransferase [Paraoerskovia marina]|uniref:tRNA dimethylallyltransferase n=1 Tax=Paraoerskovia marina TaxID=545619 RepID=A0A1H1TTZ0_9CELL|nr:tRNA (adenosine(37)-N6)-dimethylallyltransferase MiaA [Paraoerskovia marina]SDS63743.1 tRNA dimethylallyltransferase [Paraoerskovia marina]
MIIAVVGPTATGKSDLALDLAESLAPAEIVNADAYQTYRRMDIGTAKVPPEERRGVPHHLVDVLDPDQESTVAEYQRDARAALADIAARGAQPVVVGGSGLYVRALLDHMEFPGTDPVVRAHLEARAVAEGPGVLHAELALRDPEAAERIDPRNARRVVRALEVVEVTGERFTAFLPRQEYVSPAVQIGLDCDRTVLDARVDARVEAMWGRGLVDEVRRIAPALGRTAARAVGYAEVLAMDAGELTPDEARAAIAANTRRLARKQMGWFGRDPRVNWLDAQSPTLLAEALAVVESARRGPGPDPGPAPVRRSLGA